MALKRLLGLICIHPALQMYCEAGFEVMHYAFGYKNSKFCHPCIMKVDGISYSQRVAVKQLNTALYLLYEAS